MIVLPNHAPLMRAASYSHDRIHGFKQYRNLTTLLIVALALLSANCGSGLGPQPKSDSSVGSSDTSGSGTSSGTTFADLQRSTWWNGYALLPSSYNICTTCTPAGPLATWATTQGIKSPALSSGGSMKFDIGGTMPFADILWNVKFTKYLPDQKTVPTLSNFTYDVYFYGTDLESSQALEFDINQFFNGMSFIWGHECRIASGHEWDTWDNVHMHWVKSGIPCNPVSNAWNHLVIQVQRTSDNRLLFKSITLNGKTNTLNRYDNPSTTRWTGIANSSLILCIWIS
jgi:hypothetical protein